MRLFRNRSLPFFSKRKSRGQSLVEFTIMLPILLMLLSGVIEFGFMLNYYLDVIDAARETARFAANDDPIRDGNGNPLDPNPGFYDRAQDLAKQSLKSASDGRIVWPEFAPEPFDCSNIKGDVVLSAFSIVGDTVDVRYPSGTGDTGVSMCNNYTSKMTAAEVNSILSGATLPNSGFVLVEIYYEYEMVLGLPWIGAFVPNPMVLYAYSIMPNTNVEPTSTPPGMGPPPPPPPPPPGPPPPPPPPGPPPPTNTPTSTATNTPTATATQAASCTDIYISSMWISGDDVAANVVNDNSTAVTLTDTSFVWEELSASMYVDYFQFGIQYYNGDDNSSPTVVTGSSVAFAGLSNQTWRTDFDGEPYEPITGYFTLTLTFSVPGAGTCVVSENLVAPTPTPTPSPNCADIYISSTWINGDDVLATVVNNNFAAATLTTTNFVWPELSASMRVDWFRFGAAQYYNGDDYDSPTDVSGSSVPLAGSFSETWRTDFDGQPSSPVTGSYAVTLTFDFPGWGPCVVSGSVSG